MSCSLRPRASLFCAPRRRPLVAIASVALVSSLVACGADAPRGGEPQTRPGIAGASAGHAGTPGTAGAPALVGAGGAPNGGAGAVATASAGGVAPAIGGGPSAGGNSNVAGTAPGAA